MKDIKNTLTNIAGILGAIAFIGGAVAGSLATSGIAIPIIVTALI